MKIVIPVKSNSTRVPNKNFRPFFKEKSITDILIEKLAFQGCSNIYISSDDYSKQSIADKYGCNFLLREKRLCDNDTFLTDVIQGVCRQLPNDLDDIAWCQVIDPLFNDYKAVFDQWNRQRDSYDSLVVVYPIKKYLLDENYRPINFGFGHWHIKSQNLVPFYDMTFTLSILKREWVEKCGYHVGSNPCWFHAKNEHVDIDTLEDFELAQLIFEQRNR